MVCIILLGCSADHAMKKGDKYYALGEYFDAAAQYRKAYAQTPTKERKLRGQRALKLADCYRRINYTQRAIAAYRNALRYGQQDSLTQLYLGQQLMKNASYKEAGQVFDLMLVDSVAAQSPAFVNMLAQIGKRSSRQAPIWKQEGSRYTVKRENIFNSRRAEYSPVLGGENNDRLYFTSTRNEATGDELSGITGTKNGDIFVSQKDEQGKWQRPQVIDSELNTPEDEGACCLTPDGHTMYLTICQTDNNYPRYAKIASSHRSDAAWTKAQVVEISRDTFSLYAHPAVSPDGKWLYFVSDMPGVFQKHLDWVASRILEHPSTLLATSFSPLSVPMVISISPATGMKVWEVSTSLSPSPMPSDGSWNIPDSPSIHKATTSE